MRQSHRSNSLLLLLIFLCISSFSYAIESFFNPLRLGTADPWIYQKDGNYYFLYTTGNGVSIHKSNKLETVGTAARVTVWNSPEGEIKGNIWAPELHYFNGKWYIYASGSISDTDRTMRMFVLEGNTQDPLGTYKYIGLLNADKWSIDENLWQDTTTNKIYMTWSQLDPDQCIFIGEMLNPTTLSTKVAKLSAPTNPWEKKGWNVNEGPAFIKRNHKLHILFSVSGCSTSDYALARLSCSNGDYLNATAWTKSTAPVFTRNDANKVWGVGHHSYAKSPDGTEDWLVYHAKTGQPESNDDRCTRIQKFTWDENDNPILGEPYPTTLKLPCPSDGNGIQQSIKFDTITTKTVEDVLITLSATATSGLPISYVVQYGPAYVSRGNLRLTGEPGSVKVWALQSGNSTYCAAWPVYREFKVTSENITKGNGDGLTGTYYNGTEWNTEIQNRTDTSLNFDWGTGSPLTGVNADNFSVKWKGFVTPLYSDLYYFSIVSDNGRKLTVNNSLIIDHLRNDWDKEYIGSIYLRAGKQYPIEVDYVEYTGGANLKMYWWSSNQTKQLVPKSQLSTSLLSNLEEEQINCKMSLFPNPASRMVELKTPEPIHRVEFYNNQGSLVRNVELNGEQNVQLQISQLPVGIYLIRAYCGQSVYTEKLIID